MARNISSEPRPRSRRACRASRAASWPTAHRNHQEQSVQGGLLSYAERPRIKCKNLASESSIRVNKWIVVIIGRPTPLAGYSSGCFYSGSRLDKGGLLSYAERPGRLAELCPWPGRLAGLCPWPGLKSVRFPVYGFPRFTTRLTTRFPVYGFPHG